MKKVLIVASLVFIGSLSAISVARSDIIIGGDSVYGPWTCNSCSVSVPMPDAPTRAYIDGWKQWKRDNEYFNWNFAPGDKIVVCNATHCSTYVVTNTGYLGESRTPISPSSGGGGGGSIGGGGDNPFQGCFVKTVETCTTSDGIITGCQTSSILDCPL